MSRPSLPLTMLSVAACKFTRTILRLKGRGGTALPGKVARLFAPDILERVSEGMEIIVVTGTNGKTTTSRMIEHALLGSGRECLANKSGANLLSGVTAEITCNATWLGRPKTTAAVIECDEGALKQVVPLIHPKVLLVTNLFRDQLDRYGEVMHTVEQIREGIEKSPQTILCLDADDSLVVSLAENVPNRVIWYGLDTPVGDKKEAAISDAKYCIHCGEPYRYNYHTYAHLGGFYCPKCGYKRPDADIAVTKIEKISPEGSHIKMRVKEADYSAFVGLPALYNIYNASAAVCAAVAFGLDEEPSLASLSDVQSGFGRMETFELNNKRLQMILVKNPAGCDQALSYVTSMEGDFCLVFGLNDRTADGHDISWIWDADYEQLIQNKGIRKIAVFGDRAEDMQLRLKYAGFSEEKIRLYKESSELMKMLEEENLPVFILPNYTSMLELRGLLSKATGGNEFWK